MTCAAWNSAGTDRHDLYQRVMEQVFDVHRGAGPDPAGD